MIKKTINNKTTHVKKKTITNAYPLESKKNEILR